ncbi:hypothetical protein OAN96_00075 [Candidatus Gracilibacteria bacterium]|nr:hypothetical protein [Candidatus Gracilibacteria bacterium]
MFFRKKKETVKKSAKKFDNLITGLIIGGAIGGVFGVYNHKKNKDTHQPADMLDNPEIDKIQQGSKKMARRGVALFGKALVKVINTFDKKDK